MLCRSCGEDLRKVPAPVQHKKPTARDVARKAGVSLATVDRVLNGRDGVRAKTVEKVQSAITDLNYARDVGASLLARASSAKLHFLLPDGANPFFHSLAEAIARETGNLSGARTDIKVTRFAALDPEALVLNINAIKKADCDCAIIVASEDGAVREAVARAQNRKVPVMTLVSDLPESKRRHFVGIDNVAAGRTAASLMGRFVGPRAKVAMIVGSMGLRDHRERFIGFHELCLEEFPNLDLIGPIDGFDDAHETGKRVHEVLGHDPDIAGIYCMGAGNEGLIRALQQSGKSHRIRVIAHELTSQTRAGLKEGVLDVVLDQDPEGEVRAAIAAAQQLAVQPDMVLEKSSIEIGIFMRDNLI